MSLLIGPDALDQFRQKVVELERNWDIWERVSQSTEFPPDEQA
jgi:hypothetical protein